MKNIANADRPKSSTAMLPPRPLRGSGKVAQTAFSSKRRDGKSCIPTLNQTFADSRILKISKFHTFRIAENVSRPARRCRSWPEVAIHRAFQRPRTFRRKYVLPESRLDRRLAPRIAVGRPGDAVDLQ